ncbi:ATP-binding cassette domain-containing protein [Nocardioides sp. WL0053]|uniref:ATP-binding cassette domain-containing protein n=1 Tax=Nocardioides jiangsuensis TaxID=2866161 RepID=A0ABS7RFM2_9ACTN|nr:ABC transporter ATP-binding protein [Nocardioides jiangsuensis]MBY9073835.1 ATP-binding cassette domain-containing protein [Nocardioides jiangsuensis]
MIEFDGVTITFSGESTPVLRDVTLAIPEGELCLVVGRTGSGKTTLLRAINGLVPHFSGGTLAGRVVVDGRDTRDHRPRDLAEVVGFVGQDPLAGFVTDTVEDELAYGMESLGLPADVMRKRVEETLDLLGLAELRDRQLTDLSGGQQQRVAIGAVLTTHPRVLVLDEPTSALDPLAAEEVLATLQRLVHDLGLTVVLAEHRLERVVQYADRVVLVPGGGRPVSDGTPDEMLQHSPVAPPVVELGRVAGWQPLPLSVRDARRRAAPLRALLDGLVPPGHEAADGAGEVVAGLSDVVAGYRQVPVLKGVSVTLRGGEVVALMGRNGAGKSTLLKTLVGMRKPSSGRVRVGGEDPAALKPARLLRHVGLVPQVPGDLLYESTVARECTQADKDAGVPSGTTVALFERLSPGVPPGQHPRDLSEGQRLTLALAIVLAARPPLVLLDEPTRGLDYTAKHRLVEILRDLASRGHAVMLATHDVELVAEVATRVAVLADGEVVADGPVRDVVVSSPAFAPQVAKILAPQTWLTPTDVAVALAGVTTVSRP